MIVDGLFDDGETETRARVFRRKVWLEDLRDVFGGDAASCVRDVNAHAPRRFVEIGSGMSTKFARRSVEANRLPTRLTSIDPQPRNLIDQITLLIHPLTFGAGRRKFAHDGDMAKFRLDQNVVTTKGVIIATYNAV